MAAQHSSAPRPELGPRTSTRRDHPEILDAEGIDPVVVERSMRDVERANALFGGVRAVLRVLNTVFPELPRAATLLDVGTGLGDIPAAAQRRARTGGVALFTVGVDVSAPLARASRSRLNTTVCADAGALPFADRSMNVVTCSQLMHHFTAGAAAAVIRELDRVASQRVVLSDLRRTRLAVAGLWAASFVLRFHSISRHDGMASIRRGFSSAELRALVQDAVGVRPAVRQHLGFRLTAAWAPRKRTAP